MSTATISLSQTSAAPASVAFGSLVDLARLQMGSAAVEICYACNTINTGTARCCKCCSHKLPAHYSAKEDMKTQPQKALPWHALGLSAQASAMDFAAFSVVINLLVLITASIPIP
jgi:hypothetical protein